MESVLILSCLKKFYRTAIIKYTVRCPEGQRTVWGIGAVGLFDCQVVGEATVDAG